MPNVWKIGSRWGNMGHSILDLFMEYGCVFLGGKNDSRVGSWEDVQKGDLFIVSDGSTAVAIGEATGTFKSYETTGIRFRKRDVEDFIYDEVVLCPARLILLDKNERDEYWAFDPRKRFCRASSAADKVCSYWKKKCESEQTEQFTISTRVVSLLDECDDRMLFQPAFKYSIPIYQRPYSWGETELRRLVEDLHQGLQNKDSVFMGTVQLSYPIPLTPDERISSYNVIDGQQRLTTFIILLSILEKISNKDSLTLEFAKNNFRTSVNKRAAQDDLDAFFDFFEKQALTDELPTSQQKNPYIINAKILYGLLQEFASLSPNEMEEEDGAVASDERLAEYASQMRNFITKYIKIVVIETRAGLSKTLKIFNTINSAGLDLGSEDLFKVRFYEYLRKQGYGEDIFDKISEIYELIEEYNRHPFVNTWLSMTDILSSYQRILIARCDLNATTFSLSQDTFFERLFDTMLGIHIWDDFQPFLKAASNNSAFLLSIEDLWKVAQCHIAYLKACNEDIDLRIIRQMYWETRYGYAYDFPVLAMVNGIVTNENVKKFASGLLKALVPPSIFFAKRVYHGQACLFQFLKAMWNGSFKASDSVVAWCVAKWQFNGLSLERMTITALDYQITGNPKWKNLICRLVEYLNSPNKDDNLFTRLFGTFDIEHIQSYIDDKDYERVWQEWGDELNKIGNLVMFERGLNRSVHNDRKAKVEAYGNSSYMSLKELKPKVLYWTKEDAIARRKAITKAFCDFLLQDR